MRQRFLLLTAVYLLSAFLLLGCSSQRSQPASSQGASELPHVKGEMAIDVANLKEFTLEELAQYDGSNGKPAYIALNGLIYDVTNLKGWKEGAHNPWSNNRVAGKDLTSEMHKAPASHRLEGFFEEIPVVGRLKASTSNSHESKN